MIAEIKKIFFVSMFYLLLSSCGTGRRAYVSRAYRNITAYYNTYFNAKEIYNLAIKKIEVSNPDHYDRLLTFYKLGDEASATGLVSDMDQVIKKLSTVIAEHENSDWVIDSYLLMGKAYYLKGDYFSALDNFGYIYNTFQNPVYREASLIWTARAYMKLEKDKEAGSALDFALSAEKKSKLKNNDELYYTAGYFALKAGDTSKCIEYLSLGALGTHRKINKVRFNFMLAQLYNFQSNKAKALFYYHKILALKPSYEATFGAKLGIASLLGHESTQSEVSLLGVYLKDEKNFEFRDQIYYSFGNVALREGKITEALKFYEQSLTSFMGNSNQKGLTYEKIASIYLHQKKDYLQGSAYMDSTVTFLSRDYPNYPSIVAEKVKLSELVKNYLTIDQGDTLLYLASLDLGARKKKIHEMVMVEIKKQQLEEAKAVLAYQRQLAIAGAQYAGTQSSFQSAAPSQNSYFNTSNTGSNAIGGQNSYNPSTSNQGQFIAQGANSAQVSGYGNNANSNSGGFSSGGGFSGGGATYGGSSSLGTGGTNPSFGGNSGNGFASGGSANGSTSGNSPFSSFTNSYANTPPPTNTPNYGSTNSQVGGITNPYSQNVNAVTGGNPPFGNPGNSVSGLPINGIPTNGGGTTPNSYGQIPNAGNNLNGQNNLNEQNNFPNGNPTSSFNNATTNGLTNGGVNTGNTSSNFGSYYGGGNNNTFYFGNPTAMTLGYSSFLRRWGRRPLRDNWRIGSKEGGAFSEDESSDSTQQSKNPRAILKEAKDNPKRVEETYLKLIPETAYKKDSIQKIMVNAYLTNANIFEIDLKNNVKAIESYENALKITHDSTIKSQFYYNLYKLYLSIGKSDNSAQKVERDATEGRDNEKIISAIHAQSKAEEYKSKIIREFPNSNFALSFVHPEKLKAAFEPDTVLENHYNATYDEFLHHNYQDVFYCLSKIPLGETNGNRGNYLASKFALLKAYAVGNTQKLPAFEYELYSIIKNYPKDSIAFIASNLLKSIDSNCAEISSRKYALESSKTEDGFELAQNILLNKEEYKRREKEALELSRKNYFSLDYGGPFQFILILKNPKVRYTTLRFNLSEFNKSNFPNVILKNQMNTILQKIPSLWIGSFPDFKSIIKYYTKFDEIKEDIVPLPVDQFEILFISEGNLEKMKDLDKYSLYKDFFNEQMLPYTSSIAPKAMPQTLLNPKNNEDKAPSKGKILDKALPMFKFSSSKSSSYSVVIFVKNLHINLNVTRQKLSIFNASNFILQKLRLGSNYFDNELQVLTVNQFNTLQDAKEYLYLLEKKHEEVFSMATSDYDIMLITPENLNKINSKLSESEYLSFYEKTLKTP